MISSTYIYASAALLTIVASLPAIAEDDMSLDKYTCSQFLSDTGDPADGTKLLKSMMMVSWATGYAASFQQNSRRSDGTAIRLIAATLGAECRDAPSKLAVQAIADAISKYESPQITSKRSLSISDQNLGRAGPFVTHNNYDMPGSDLAKIKDIEPGKCVSACQTNHLCKAYSYDKWNHWCFLKRTLSALALDPSSVTGVPAGAEISLSQAQIQVNARRAKAFRGTSIDTKSFDEYDSCRAACQGNDRCIVFSFNTARRECQLFSEAVGFKPDPQTHSGVKYQAR